MDINKEKCKTLKKIRKKLADALDIDLHQRECTYEGACSGTCPKCKQEEQQLNRAILAKSALAAGTVAVTVGLTGCTQMGQPPLEGETVMIPSTVEELDRMPEQPPSTLQAPERNTEEPEQETGTEIEGTEIEGTEETGTTEEFYELEGDIVMVEPTEGE
ncbi:MAG: hypothetical protein K2N24_08470 [Lachnospiraceae bacterium]|nr:hypothetical protein [Lachnospiraceae bacterium]